MVAPDVMPIIATRDNSSRVIMGRFADWCSSYMSFFVEQPRKKQQTIYANRFEQWPNREDSPRPLPLTTYPCEYILLYVYHP
jgi:hypothetical protein